MRAAAFLRVAVFAIFAHAIEQPSQTCGDAPASTRRTQIDSVSLLQSRGIHVEYGEDTGPSNTFGALKAKASLLTRDLLARQNSGWSTALVILLLIGVCWFICAVMTFTKTQRKEDKLEARVTDVLQPQNVREDLVQPRDREVLATHGAASASPFLAQRWPFASRFSPVAAARTMASPQASNVGPAMAPLPHDMPPSLDGLGTALMSETRLLVAKDAVLNATKGGDILLTAPNAAQSMRANVRKIDGDFWLEVAVEGAGQGGMVRLTNKEPTVGGVSFFGPRKQHGPEVYGPDGSLYGTVEITNAAAFLVSSTTALPVLDFTGDIRNFNVVVRTKSGLEVATAAQGSPGNINVCVHRGADLALITSALLTIFISRTL